MPEFKLNGKTYSGSTSYASAIDYTEADGSKTTVQDKISEIDENISEQNKNFEWKLVGNATGSNAISLPSTWDEIEIVVSETTNNTSYVKRVSYNSIQHLTNYIVIGGGNGANNAYGLCYANLRETKFNLVSCKWNGVDVLPTTTTTVYYR